MGDVDIYRSPYWRPTRAMVLIKARRIKQADICRDYGISPGYLNRILFDRDACPIALAEYLSELLGEPPQDLFRHFATRRYETVDGKRRECAS